MSTDHVSTFESSLEGQATVHTTAAGEFADALEDAVTEPAVGTELPFEGVSLPDWIERDPSPSAIQAAETGVTPGGIGIADYGTVTLRSRPEGDEVLALYPPAHVAVVAAGDVVPDMSAAFERIDEEIREGTNTQILATGPSATADMGSLVQGVHGPKDVHVVVLEDR